MQRIPLDKRVRPFFRFLSPLFDAFEGTNKHHGPHPPHRPHHPPPPGAPPTPDYNHFIDAMRDFKHVCMNYCKCHDNEEIEKPKEKKEITSS